MTYEDEPEMAGVERETRAMVSVARALQGLAPEQRGRVLSWALIRFNAGVTAYLSADETDLRWAGEPRQETQR